ncbi:hypothetical protein pipiens_007962 [Culex pipiens pipiens]|uniref:Uncharacterized protein n=1 Tax=Culex pipiens pipiens TaxID=38569 RepID=A0ABD1DLA8_CULPP
MSRVFLLAVVAIGGSLALVGALPVLSYDDDYDSVEDDYDVVFDQRQNGTENVRLNLDGLMIALPGPPQQSDLSSMAGAALMDVLAAHAGSFDGDSSEEDSNSKPSTTTSTTTSTTVPTPMFHEALVPVNLLGQGLSFLFNKGVETPIKITPDLKPLRAKPSLVVLKKDDADDDSDEAVEPPAPVKQKKVSKHKRRYKLKVAHLLKPLLQRTYVV